MAAIGQVLPPDTEEEIVDGEGTLSKLEEADRSHQVATAKRFPRSITTFRREMQEIAMANQQVAMEMMYSLPRAGKQLVGPSVRFAEALVVCWGNARVGVEVVDVDTREGVVTAEGRFYDCEKNVGFAIRVRRRNVMTKKDADSYQVTGAAASSIALRGAILRGVPKALWADIFELAKKTAAGEAASMEKIRTELLKLFTALGITEARVFAALGVQGIADIGAEEVLALRTWHKQLTSKETTVEEIFGSPEQDEVEALMDALGWPEQKKKMSKINFAKNIGGHLEHLRGEAAKVGLDVPKTKPAATKQEPKAEAKHDPEPSQDAPTEEEQPKEQHAAEAKAAPKFATAQKPAATTAKLAW